MIRVNLLPPEYRKSEATPLKQFFATVGAVVLAAVAAALWAWVYFAKLKPEERRRDELIADVNAQKGGVDYTRKLDAKVKQLKGQYKKIDDVAKNRIAWSRKLDDIWELAVNPKTPGRYEVWLKGLNCSTTTGGPTQKVGGTVQFSAVSAGAQVKKLADFHEDLTGSEFFQDFSEITPPFGTREELPPKDREPKEGWTFNLTLTMKSLQAISEARAKAAAEAAKK